VRRERKIIGKRLEAEVIPLTRERPIALTVLSGDARQSAVLFGKRRFDAVVADAPYGVVHGSRTDVHGVSGKRDRSAAGLIGEALSAWAVQLKRGGALGLSWNALRLKRERLLELIAAAGLEPLDFGPYRDFEHRVDSSIDATSWWRSRDIKNNRLQKWTSDASCSYFAMRKPRTHGLEPRHRPTAHR
jgi:hypothetical protein